MKLKFLLLLLLVSQSLFAQIPAYYDDVDLSLTGQSLMNELSAKVSSTHNTNLSYTPGVWNALKSTDLDPANVSKVILVYGYNDSDGVTNTDRTRNVNNNGGGSTDWNREHVYPKSLGNPNLGTSGPGADAHHLRPADVSRNSSRGSRKFADDSGSSGVTGNGYWYPGDEFKGDVARMMMYMYIRYGNRCLPKNVGVGASPASDNNMVELFLEWNAEDPVSQLELQRNPILENLQGNRNPFIDNPSLATSIWGGPQAEDRFGSSTGNPGGLICGNSISDFPYTESFESGFGNWEQSNDDEFDWSRLSGATPSSNTGPSSAYSGSQYIYMESSSPNYSAKSARLTSPCFDLKGVTQASLSFSYHLYGSTDMGSLNVEASTDGVNWTAIWSRSGNQGNSWQIADVDLSAYTGNTLQLRLNGVTGTTWQGDMAIDDVRIVEGGSTGMPTTYAYSLTIVFDDYPE
ncbi:MAG: endonuclease, partial [Cyclobacteriaceae bacterium]